jgi:hypothetical protein
MKSETNRETERPRVSWVPTGITQLLDDLLWTCSLLEEVGGSHGDLEVISEMLAEYTDEHRLYSDDSSVGEEYVVEDSLSRPVLCYRAAKPPHRRSCHCLKPTWGQC